MTDMQRWAMEYERGEWDIAPNPDGQYVLFADAEAAIAAAEQRERQVVIIGQETHDAVKELCREAWQQGERAMLAKAIAAVEYLHDHEAPHDAHKDALWNAISALRALQEKP